MPDKEKIADVQALVENLQIMPETAQQRVLGIMEGFQLALAQKLGYTPQYVSTVLNSKRDPAGAAQKFNAAVDALIEQPNSIK